MITIIVDTVYISLATRSGAKWITVTMYWFRDYFLVLYSLIQAYEDLASILAQRNDSNTTNEEGEYSAIITEQVLSATSIKMRGSQGMS